MQELFQAWKSMAWYSDHISVMEEFTIKQMAATVNTAILKTHIYQEKIERSSAFSDLL